MLTTHINITAQQWHDNSNQNISQTINNAAQTAFSIAAPNQWKNNQICELSVLLCDNSEIQNINNNWRNKDKPTNVLAFPQNDDIKIKNKPFCLGDIILAFETIHNEANDKNITLTTHLQHLLIHGFLHLAGYDHQNDSEAELMENIEQQIMNILNTNKGNHAKSS